jgi:succinate-acetate transporter protein
MLQQFKTRRSNEHSIPPERSFQLLKDVKLNRVYQVIRFMGTALLSMAYLVVIFICVIEEHTMSSYLIISLIIVFLIVAIALLPHIKTIKNNY